MNRYARATLLVVGLPCERGLLILLLDLLVVRCQLERLVRVTVRIGIAIG